jgi:arabinose-5-phosphate isomerase
MHTGKEIPSVREDVTMSTGLLEMSEKSLGMTAVADENGHIMGIFTDGDLRRALDSAIDVRTTRMQSVMHRNCKTIAPEVLAVEAVRMMEEHKITALLVADEDGKLVGALNIHDLFRAGIM